MLHVLQVAVGADACRALELTPLGLGVQPVKLDRLFVGLGETVYPHDHPFTRLDLPLILVGGLRDLVLDEALLHRRNRTAELVDALDQLPRPRLELVRHRLDEVRASQWIRGVGPTCFMRKQLLRTKCDADAPFRRQRQRLVEGIRVDGLCSTAYR